MNRTGNGPLAQQNQGDSASAGDGMERGLSNRHVQFIAIGGTIGTGLFLGSGKSIALTGPSIILVYIGVGVIMYLLMRAIGLTIHLTAPPCLHNPSIIASQKETPIEAGRTAISQRCR